MGKQDVKETIIATTIQLIQNSHGDIEEITTRMIAVQANVGIGLINYHFQTKDRLIEICVQRMIDHVISSFKPVGPGQSKQPMLDEIAKQVFDFLFANPAVSRISILGDQRNPSLRDHTMKTTKGFENSLSTASTSDQVNPLLLFMLTTTLQAAFLRKKDSKEMWGLDLTQKSDRDSFVDSAIEVLFGRNSS